MEKVRAESAPPDVGVGELTTGKVASGNGKFSATAVIVILSHQRLQ
jgi:hypothetical protein